MRQRKSSQFGATMVEVLVAFVIFSFGMLGIAGLQTKTMAFNQSSLFRSQAAALTDDVFDRMRMDRTNALGDKWKTDLGTAAASVPTSGTGIYATDLPAWKLEVERLLPSGRASIALDAATNMVTVVIEWDDTRGKDSTPQQFQTTSRL